MEEVLLNIEYLKQKKVKTPEYLTGIYFLFDEEELVYIGSTTKGLYRISQHRFKKKYSHYLFEEIIFNSEMTDADKNNKLLSIESKLIMFYRPKYNKNIPVTKFKSIETIKNITKIDKKSLRKLLLNNKVPYEIFSGTALYDYEFFTKVIDPSLLSDALIEHNKRKFDRMDFILGMEEYGHPRTTNAI